MFSINKYITSVESQVIIISDLISELGIEAEVLETDESKRQLFYAQIKKKYHEFCEMSSLSEGLTDCLTKLDPGDDDYDLTNIKQLFSELLDKLFNLYQFVLPTSPNLSSFVSDLISRTFYCIQTFLKGFYFPEDEECY